MSTKGEKMKIKDSDRNLRCEMPNCKNMAKFKVEKDGFFRSAGIYLCGDCASEMYKVLSTKIVPKSPENMLNKKIKIKENAGEK